MTSEMLEQRLSNVEEALAELQKQFLQRAIDPNWLQRMIGCMHDFPEFEDVVRYGREFRESDRPAADAGP